MIGSRTPASGRDAARRDTVYCLHRNADGSYVFLNRNYRIVGTHSDGWQHHDEFSGVRLDISDQDARSLSYKADPNKARIYLFGDGLAPWLGVEQARPYGKRVELLLSILHRQGRFNLSSLFSAKRHASRHYLMTEPMVCVLFDCTPEAISQAIERGAFPSPLIRSDKLGAIWHTEAVMVHYQASSRIDDLHTKLLDRAAYANFDDLLTGNYRHSELAEFLALDGADLAALVEFYRALRADTTT